MALIVDVIKTDEDEKFVCYDYIFTTFSESGSRKSIKVVGKIKIDKIHETVQFDLAPGDENGAHAERGVMALLPYIRRGEYPERAAFQA